MVRVPTIEKKRKRVSASGGGGRSWRPSRPASNSRSRAGRPKGGYKFIDQPPRSDMKKRSPESAPRLYEWLVSEGFVEPVNTVSRGRSPTRKGRGR